MTRNPHFSPGDNRDLREIRIGTSGWHYKHWIGSFYPPRLSSSGMLTHYIELPIRG